MRAVRSTALAMLLLGCQSVLGFEPFVRDRGMDGGDALGNGAAGGRSTGRAVATGGKTTGAGARGSAGRASTTIGGDAGPAQSRGGGGASGSSAGAWPGGVSTGAAGSGCRPHCGGGASWLDAVSCDDSGIDRCGDDTPQCNPREGTCFHLDVDATEVTMKDYLAWVATNPEWPDRPEACAWKAPDFAPDRTCLAWAASDLPCVFSRLSDCNADAGCSADTSPPSCQTSTMPIVCVDWCDAYAYCAAHGKRLCGSLRGGAVPMTLATDPGESQWMNACSAGGQFSYASGDDVPPLGGCSHAGTQTLYEVGTVPGCRSPSPGYSRFHDMSGNAAEWEDACEPVNDSAPGKDDPCAIRGGSYSSAASALECGQVGKMPRNETRYDVGFRCCGLP